jgi:anaerobic selenocysteine-containing dehydrogenase
VRNSVTALNATPESAVNDEVDRRLAEALRAQASALGTPVPVPAHRGVQQHRNRVPAWVVLALAVLLGAMAGGVAGVISTW